MSLSTISTHFDEQTLDTIVRAVGGHRHTAWRFGTGFKKGDSWLSEAFRLHIDGVLADETTPLQVSAVVKAIPQSLARRLTFRAADFFSNECNFYRHVLTAYEDFQRSRGVSSSQAFTEVPRLLAWHIDGTNDFLVLEDLCPAGYASAQRQAGMDREHSELVMRTLGKFHAVSLAIRDQEPERFEQLCRDGMREVYYAPEFAEWYSSFVHSQIAVARDAMRREYGGTEYERKMVAFTEEEGFFGRMCELVKRRNRYSVIGHGDCWLPNFLLQYVDGRPRDTRIIDFQLARCGSPALDISFCVYSCMQQEMRVEHYDELLKIYHQSAADLLTALGSDPDKVYPFEAVLDELRHAGRFGCGMGMESIPMSIIPESETFDLDTLTGDKAWPLADFWVIKPIENAADRRRLADIFRHAIDQGYLD